MPDPKTIVVRISDGGRRTFIHNEDDPCGLGRGRELISLRRASRVEPVEIRGPFFGHWYVDFSPLADREGRPELAICLWPPRQSQREALAEEVRWLNDNHLRCVKSPQ